MAKVSSRRIRAVAIFVIFLALAYAATVSFRQQDKGPDYTSLLRVPNSKFDAHDSYNKAFRQLHVSNFGDQQIQLIRDLIGKYKLEEPQYNASTKGLYGAYIFRVSQDQLRALESDVKQIGDIRANSEVVDSVLVKTTLAIEEPILENMKRERDRLVNQEYAYASVAERINQLNSDIRQQENKIKNLKQSNTTLLYLQVRSSGPSNRVSTVWSFAMHFGFGLLGGFMIAVLAYYGTKLIMYLLSLLGVKGFSAANLGGGYSYGNYGNRYYSRYGYGGSRRKVKRIYKGKPGTPGGDQPEEPEKPQV